MRCLEKTPPHRIALDAVREKIVAALIVERIPAFLQKLKAAADITFPTAAAPGPGRSE